MTSCDLAVVTFKASVKDGVDCETFGTTARELFGRDRLEEYVRVVGQIDATDGSKHSVFVYRFDESVLGDWLRLSNEVYAAPQLATAFSSVVEAMFLSSDFPRTRRATSR